MALYFNIWDDFLEGNPTYGYCENGNFTTSEKDIDIANFLYIKFKEDFPYINMTFDNSVGHINFLDITYDQIEEIINRFDCQLIYNGEEIIIYSES